MRDLTLNYFEEEMSNSRLTSVTLVQPEYKYVNILHQMSLNYWDIDPIIISIPLRPLTRITDKYNM